MGRVWLVHCSWWWLHEHVWHELVLHIHLVGAGLERWKGVRIVLRRLVKLVRGNIGLWGVELLIELSMELGGMLRWSHVCVLRG